MKNTLFLLLCLLSVNVLQAQDKDLEKIRKYYTSGKYDKALALCNKFLSVSQNKKKPELYFYKSLCTYKQADSNSVYYYNVILTSATIAAKGVPYDKKSEIFSRKNSNFNTFLTVANKQSEIKYYTHKIKEAKVLESLIARSFKDTSEIYRVLFNIVQPKPTVIEKAPVVILNSNAGKIDSLVYFASTQLGKQYKYAKEGPDAFDCSGFIGYVFKKYGEKLPHNANLIAKLGEEVKIENIKKGDLIFFGSTSAYHVAMYITDEGKEPQIIHCVSRGVCIDDFNATTHWGKSNVFKIKRVIK